LGGFEDLFLFCVLFSKSLFYLFGTKKQSYLGFCMSAQVDIERFKALLSGSEEEAIAKLRALREEHREYIRADVMLRIQTIEAEARRMRNVLASVRRIVMTHMSPAALLPERVLPMIGWRSSYDYFGSLQRAVISYPKNCDRFDWKAHLDALDAALDIDEANALSSVVLDQEYLEMRK
jgi:hypothetical protein